MSEKSKTAYNDFTAVCDELGFAASEAYKMLRSNVQYGFPESSGCKVIGITSSERNEGKSTIAVNLAYMLSCDRQKVLLLEGDMRLPSLSKKLELKNSQGMSDFLTGRYKSGDLVQYSEKAPNMAVICAGMTPPNPSELLGSASMEKFLAVLKEKFEYIIVDLPPVNIVSDPLSVAKFLDGFIVVVRSEYTTRQGVTDVVKKLQTVNAKILGIVINGEGISTGSMYGKYSKYGKYGKYGRYYRYGKYGKRDDPDDKKDYEDSYEEAANREKDLAFVGDSTDSGSSVDYGDSGKKSNRKK